MKKYSVLFMILVLLTGCTSEKLTMYSNTSVTSGFDTYVSIQASAKSQEEFDGYFNESIEDFLELNQLFDIYHIYESVNNLKTINDQAGIEPVVVDQMIIDLLNMSKKFYEISNGEFDITMGAVLKVWHNYREEAQALLESGEFGKLPTQEELETAAACTGWQYVEINDDDNTVFITNPCVSLDVGGIAKGYAAEVIAQNLESKNIKTGVVDAGGNNRTINTKLDGSPWRVGVQDPGGNGSLLVIEKKGTSSFVTSGDYQRYYIAEDGKFYHHIIDPRTNFPANHYRSVTIVTQNSAIADALSTTLFTLPYDEGLKLIEDYNLVNPDTPVSAIWITDKDKKLDSPNTIEIGNYSCTYTEDLKNSIQIKK